MGVARARSSIAMLFVLRALFWTFVVFLLMPHTPTERNTGPPASGGAALAEAAALCAQHGETCRTGADAAERVGGSIASGARLVSALLGASAPAAGASPVPASPSDLRPAKLAAAAGSSVGGRAATAPAGPQPPASAAGSPSPPPKARRITASQPRTGAGKAVTQTSRGGAKLTGSKARPAPRMRRPAAPKPLAAGERT